jgi:RNA polymerase sigma factor (sigma-70 family)
MRHQKGHWELLVGCIPVLREYVRRLVGDRETANEVLQEVSLRILVGDGPRDTDRFLAWSRAIVRHVIAHDWRMRQRARTELSMDDEMAEEISDQPSDPEGPIDARKSLARVMADMDKGCLELLVRRYVFEETGKELADEMAESPAALRMRLMRIRSTLSARDPRRRAVKSIV